MHLSLNLWGKSHIILLIWTTSHKIKLLVRTFPVFFRYSSVVGFRLLSSPTASVFPVFSIFRSFPADFRCRFPFTVFWNRSRKPEVTTKHSNSQRNFRKNDTRQSSGLAKKYKNSDQSIRQGIAWPYKNHGRQTIPHSIKAAKERTTYTYLFSQDQAY